VFDKQYAHCLIAEQEEDAQPVGMALYFFSFSTWEGKVRADAVQERRGEERCAGDTER
jgi:hypothetical protein